MSQERARFQSEVLAVALLLLLGSIFIIYPFLDAIVLAVATSYLLRHAHSELNGRLENEFLSTMVITTTIVGFITIGIFLLISNLGHIRGALNFFFFDLQENVQDIVQILELPEAYNSEIKDTLQALRQSIINTLSSAPGVLINSGIFLVTSLYLYRDGEKIKKRLFEFAESLSEDEEKIVKSLIRSTDSIFRGIFVTQLMVALIIAVVTAVGFYAIGTLTSPIPFTVFWSLLIGIAALLPLVAAFMFYGPLGLYYLLAGAPVKGALIIGFGIVFLNVLTEVFLRPYVGSKQMDEHPLIVFLGFLAGPLTLGLKGLVLGPVILILSKEFILNYGEIVGDD